MMRLLSTLFLIGLVLGLQPLERGGQNAPPSISLAGRESVEQMKKFEPFLGSWRRVESHIYRETWTLEADRRLTQKTEQFKEGQWVQIFGGSVYEKQEAQPPSR